MSDLKKKKSVSSKDKKEKKTKEKKKIKKSDSSSSEIKHTRESREKIEVGEKEEKKEKEKKVKRSHKAEPEEAEDPSPQQEWTFKGSWDRDANTAGGAVENKTWRQNPQLFLTVTSATKVTITLSQSSAKNSIGFYVLDSDGTGRRIVGNPNKLIMAESKFAKAKEVSKTYALEPTKQPYVIMPCTQDPGVNGKFTIKVSSGTEGKPIIVEMRNRRRNWFDSSFKGEWKGPSAGGNKDHSTFVANPQYEITVRSDDTTLRLLLLQHDVEKFDTIGIYLAKLDASEGKDGSKLIAPPKNIIDKSPFSSPKEVLLGKKVEAGRYVVIPCTFDPRQESKFELKILSDKPDVHAIEMGEKKGSTLPGEWKGETAGGCMNHTSWRKNPHFFLNVKQKTNFSLQLSQQGTRHVIGYYILKSDKNGNRRTLVKRAKHLVAKSDFVEAHNVSKELTLEASKTPYVVLPCTFDKGLEATFTLTLYPLGSPDDVSLTHAKDNLVEISLNGSWKGENAGGCRNYYTWPSNPQYLVETPAKCQVTLFLQLPEKKSNTYKKSIGFYVHKVTPNKVGGYDFIWDDTNQPIAKGKYCKQKQVACKFQAEANGKYMVLVSLFHSGQRASYSLSLFASLSEPNVPVTFKPNPGKQFISVKGSWNEETAGGCINNASWVYNPHFSLGVKRKCKVLLVLVQSPALSAKKKKEWDAIGLYINKGNEWGFPQIRKDTDLVAKSDFEKFRDACISVTIEPSSHPYVVTPSTFDQGVVGDFVVQLFADAADLENNLTLNYLDYGAIINAMESGQTPPSPVAVQPPTPGREKEPEKGKEPAVVENKEAALALQKQNENLAAQANDIVVKAGMLQKKENELSGKEDELAQRLEELAKREKQFKEREDAWEKKIADRKDKWRKKKKEFEASRQLKSEEIAREREEKEKRQKEKKERKEKEEKEKAEREREEKERLEKEKAELAKQKEQAASNKTALPDKVKCPNCETTFDPLNPKLETATISLAPLLAPPPPPPAPIAAPAPPPVPAPAPPPLAPISAVPHEEFKIARGSDGNDFLDLLKRGIKLHDSKERKLNAPIKPEGSDWAVPFNVEKIVARRNALEMSDDEDAEEWNEEWA